MIDLGDFRRRYTTRSRTLGLDLDDKTEVDLIIDFGPGMLTHALHHAGIPIEDDLAREIIILLSEHSADRLDRLSGDSYALPIAMDSYLAMKEQPSGLTIDDDLARRLPLVDLARDISGVAGGGRLVVSLVPAGSMFPVIGLFVGSRTGWIIDLDEGRTSEEIARTWSHELGHALDYVTRGSDRTDVAGREEFADTLAPLLLEHAPSTLSEAMPLVNVARAECAPRRRTAPTSDALEDVLAWALETVGAVCPQPELVAAFTTRESREAL